jgi:hypothetical protein
LFEEEYSAPALRKEPIMIRLGRFVGVLALGLAINSMALAQEAPVFAKVNCIKVRPGKSVEFVAFVRDVAMKLAKVRVDRGVYTTALFAESVYPAGRAAACDYAGVYIYNGFPPEDATPAQTEADMKKAGITMTREAMIAKRDDLSYLVGSDLWREHGLVGAAKKGDYVRVIYYKVKPGMAEDWVGMEVKGWKPVAESMAKDVSGSGWGVYTLTMPTGSSLPYNAQTVDIFPSWDAVGKDMPVVANWKKVHPDMDMNQYFEKLGGIRDRTRADLVKILEVVTK